MLRPTPGGTAYVLTVVVLATLGFTTGSTPLIVAAVVATLPLSVLAVPLFYAVYGLLSLIPGADPSSSSGTASCTPAGDCHSWATGDPAGWFTVTAVVVGILVLTAAALANAILAGLVLAARRRHAPGGVVG
ncbi:hypothetical protein [Nocardioides sp. CER19]|uniref:hypothetical protein n=1 Tax=Nocardioides sp. CER19 TaxID=3038538 RepID=UPI00244B5063|nr:hypothetical protein [Nocardioides sp. CER19]MDH2416466.1 hypothetical protein [Nocardioides sp. CER19]